MPEFVVIEREKNKTIVLECNEDRGGNFVRLAKGLKAPVAGLVRKELDYMLIGAPVARTELPDVEPDSQKVFGGQRKAGPERATLPAPADSGSAQPVRAFYAGCGGHWTAFRDQLGLQEGHEDHLKFYRRVEAIIMAFVGDVELPEHMPDLIRGPAALYDVDGLTVRYYGSLPSVL